MTGQLPLRRSWLLVLGVTAACAGPRRSAPELAGILTRARTDVERRCAALEFVQMGSAAVPWLVAALDDEPPDEMSWVTLTLVSLGEDGHHAFDALLQRLAEGEDSDINTVLRIRALAVMGARVVPRVLERLDEETSPVVQRRLLTVLQWMPADVDVKPAVPAAKRLMHSADTEVSVEAAAFLERARGSLAGRQGG